MAGNYSIFILKNVLPVTTFGAKYFINRELFHSGNGVWDLAYVLLYIKEINNKNLLHSTGN